jgi:hypothetical protein
MNTTVFWDVTPCGIAEVYGYISRLQQYIGTQYQTVVPYPEDSYFFKSCVISGFCHDVDENCALLGYYAASNGNHLLTFQDNIMAPPSKVRKSKKKRNPARQYTVYIGNMWVVTPTRYFLASFLFSLDFLTLDDGTDTVP